MIRRLISTLLILFLGISLFGCFQSATEKNVTTQTESISANQNGAEQSQSGQSETYTINFSGKAVLSAVSSSDLSSIGLLTTSPSLVSRVVTKRANEEEQTLQHHVQLFTLNKTENSNQ